MAARRGFRPRRFSLQQAAHRKQVAGGLILLQQGAGLMKHGMTLAVGTVLALGGLLAPVSGSAPQGDTNLDNPYFPLKVGATWEYNNAGKKVTLKVAAIDQIDGVGKCARLEGDFGAGPVNEHVTVKEDGIYRVKSNNQDLKPHLLLLKLPPKKGDTWDINSTIQNYTVKGTMAVDEVNVKAGKSSYDTFHVKSSNLSMGGQPVELETWYAKGVGMVKQRLKLPNSDQEINLDLEKFTPGK
jgi:hypothetical protein